MSECRHCQIHWDSKCNFCGNNLMVIPRADIDSLLQEVERLKAEVKYGKSMHDYDVEKLKKEIERLKAAGRKAAMHWADECSGYVSEDQARFRDIIYPSPPEPKGGEADDK